MGVDCWLTRATVEEKGTPLSRANDHSWREAVAISEIQLEVRVIIRIAVMAFVPE